METTFRRGYGADMRVRLEGQQFGHWTALNYLGASRYLCVCTCGKEKEVLAVSLKNGSSKSCGCSTKRLRYATKAQEQRPKRYTGFPDQTKYE